MTDHRATEGPAVGDERASGVAAMTGGMIHRLGVIIAAKMVVGDAARLLRAEGFYLAALDLYEACDRLDTAIRHEYDAARADGAS